MWLVCTGFHECVCVCVCVCAAGAAVPLYLLHEDEKRLSVVLPLLRQFVLMREFVATHVHGQLEAVGVQVAEVIHTCRERQTHLRPTASTRVGCCVRLLARLQKLWNSQRASVLNMQMWLLHKASAEKPCTTQSQAQRECVWTLTASRSVPGRSVDGAVLLGEVFHVADPSVGISHQAVGGRVGESQPAEHVVIRGGGLLPGHPRGAGFVIGEGHHQLPSLKVTAQHKGHLLHPRNQSPRLHGNLQWGEEGSML